MGINFDKYFSIPVELSGREQQLIKPLVSFRETSGVHPLLMANIIRVEYEKPTPGKRREGYFRDGAALHWRGGKRKEC